MLNARFLIFRVEGEKMNSFKMRISELQNCGLAVMSRLLFLAGRPQLTRQAFEQAARRAVFGAGDQPPELQALLNVLRRLPQGLGIGSDVLEMLERGLNQPVRLMAEMAPSGRCAQLRVGGPFLRLAVETVCRYTALLAEDPALLKYQPIAVCPRCDGLFFRRRISQQVCSDRCRFESWRDRVGRNYWKDRRTKPRRPPGHLPEKQKRPQKLGVDLGVELSPKPIKKHGKARKA